MPAINVLSKTLMAGMVMPEREQAKTNQSANQYQEAKG